MPLNLIIHMVLPSGHVFVVKLGQVAQYFRTGPQAVNSQTGVLVQLLASLLEPRMACAGAVICACLNGVVRQYRRSDAEVNDTIIEFVADTCAKFFGRRTNWGDGVDIEPIFEMTPPSGARAWQKSRAIELCSAVHICLRRTCTPCTRPTARS